MSATQKLDEEIVTLAADVAARFDAIRMIIDGTLRRTKGLSDTDKLRCVREILEYPPKTVDTSSLRERVPVRESEGLRAGGGRCSLNVSPSPESSTCHRTVAVQVWVEVDEGIADMVRALNAMPGVRTYASCQGYPDAQFDNKPRVMAWWPEFPNPHAEIEARYEVGERGANWAYLHPKGTL